MADGCNDVLGRRPHGGLGVDFSRPDRSVFVDDVASGTFGARLARRPKNVRPSPVGVPVPEDRLARHAIREAPYNERDDAG